MKYILIAIAILGAQALSIPKILDMGCRQHGLELKRSQVDIDRICSYD